MTPESKKRFIWTIVMVTLGAIAAAMAAGPLMRAYREHAARQDAVQARALLAEKDYEQALNAARRAYVADPENPDVVRTVALIYGEIDPLQAEDFWQKAFELSDDNSDLGNWVSTALEAKDFATARAQLEVMEARGLDDSAYHYYLGQVRLHEQDLNAALQEARKALAQKPADERAHFFFVQLTQLSDDPDLRKEGVDYLWGLARTKDLVGLRSLRNLANFSGNTDADLLEIIRLLDDHPLATREDHLLALRLGYQLSDANAEANLKQAERYFDLSNPLDLAKLGRWLNQQGRYEQTLSVISAEEAFARKDVLLVRFDAMAQLGQWEELGTILKQPKVPLDAFLRQVFLSRVYFETGKPAEGDIAWERAVLDASQSADELWYLVRYARQLGFNEEASKALWRLAEYPGEKRKACAQLLVFYQLAHDTRGMQKVLDLMVKSYPDNLSVLNDWAYVNLLRNERGERSLKAAQYVVRESEKSYLARYITLALGYYREGEFKQALDTLLPLGIDWLKTAPKYRAVCAAILEANGRFDEARRLRRSLNPADLLPEELALVRTPDSSS